jgi:ATPase subunit of ABC transporter with duplicated ATPase domains
MSNPILLSLTHLETELQNGEYLFKDITFSVAEKEIIGLIGKNGAGKSTLLHLIKSKASNVSIELVEQVKLTSELKNKTLYEYVADKYENFWEVEILLINDFNFKNFDFNKKINDLSGGELLILDISIALLKRPDVLILDEPTNHLDLSKKSKLIEIIKGHKYFKALITASHDISFLNQITNKVIELNESKLREFGGNYDFYKQQIENELNAQKKVYEANLKTLNKALKVKQKEDVIEAKKKAKLTNKIKSNDRSVDRFTKRMLQARGQFVSDMNRIKNEANVEKAQSKVQTSKIQTSKKANFILDSEVSSDRKIIEIENGELFVNDLKLKGNLNLSLNFSDRLIIKGENGSGKTSFVKALLSEFGKENKKFRIDGIKYLNTNFKIAYLSQKFEFIDRNKTVMQNVELLNSGLPYEEIRKTLGNFLFYTNEEVNKETKVLSGGELMRLSFAIIFVSKINLLILDEPTNNIDIETKEVLIEALKEYSGTLIVISHDEDFVERIGVRKVLELAHG